MSAVIVCAVPTCSEQFVVSSRNAKQQRYCSRGCRQAAKRARDQRRNPSPFYGPTEPRPRRVCEHCGHRFIASTRTQRFCNLACATLHSWVVRRAQLAAGGET